MQLQRSSNGQLVRLSASSTLGVGGEARIFAIEGAAHLAAKVYHRPAQAHEAKLGAMLANPPSDPMAGQNLVSIAWPIDLLLTPDGSRCVMGFLMPRVREMYPIIDFYHPKTRRQKHPLFNYRYLLRTARNLVGCVNALHARGYVIGDLNESNILAGETALVSLVDTDSFQVPDPNGGQIHRCYVGKPEFTAPELQGTRFASADRLPEHDLFGVAVLIFQLLMEGVHPFAGQYKGRGEPPLLEERIANGLFPYAPDTRAEILPMPTAPRFDLLDSNIRELFLRCFIEGHANPSLRPDTQSWQQALLQAEGALATCPANDQHCYTARLNFCPWCERRTQLRGVDPFPSRGAVRQRSHLQQLPVLPRLASPGPRACDRAIEIAIARVRSLRRERRLFAAALCVLGTLVVGYWSWVVRLLILHQ